MCSSLQQYACSIKVAWSISVDDEVSDEAVIYIYLGSTDNVLYPIMNRALKSGKTLGITAQFWG